MAMSVGLMLAFSFRWRAGEKEIWAVADRPRDNPSVTPTQVSFAETAAAVRPLRDPVAKSDDYSTHFSFRWTVLVSTMSPHRCGPRIAPHRCGVSFLSLSLFPSPRFTGRGTRRSRSLFVGFADHEF